MSELVKSACYLQFEEHEFVAFFGEISPLDEDAFSYSYEIRRDGMRLEFTIFPLDGDVYADIFRDGVGSAIVTSRLKACTHARFVKSGSAECLEIGRPLIPTTERDVALAWGLRIQIDPHLRLNRINEEG